MNAQRTRGFSPTARSSAAIRRSQNGSYRSYQARPGGGLLREWNLQIPGNTICRAAGRRTPLDAARLGGGMDGSQEGSRLRTDMSSDCRRGIQDASQEPERRLPVSERLDAVALAQARQPGMVWIHGGGYLGGGGCEDGTDGSNLASLGVTVVSFNYRLGAFGYLAHPEFGSNFGLQDQIAALQWVRENIEAFGGDPEC